MARPNPIPRDKYGRFAKKAAIGLAATGLAILARNKLVPMAARATKRTKTTGNLARFNAAGRKTGVPAVSGIEIGDAKSVLGQKDLAKGSKLLKVRGLRVEAAKSLAAKGSLKGARILASRKKLISILTRLLRRI